MNIKKRVSCSKRESLGSGGFMIRTNCGLALYLIYPITYWKSRYHLSNTNE